MVSQPKAPGFYEEFWADRDYQLQYALHAAVYERFPAIQRVWGQLRAPERVLDYGCGNGVLTYWMFSNGFGRECVGVDVSGTGIADARDRLGRPGLEFRRLDPARPLAELGAFDVVVSSHVLEHIADPGRGLLDILPLADWFVLEVPLERCLVQDALALVRGGHRPDNRLGHVQFWSRQGFRRFLESCGLLVVREFRYASAPFSPHNHPLKRWIERAGLAVLGTRAYGRLMTTHYAVLAHRHPAWRERVVRDVEGGCRGAERPDLLVSRPDGEQQA